MKVKRCYGTEVEDTFGFLLEAVPVLLGLLSSTFAAYNHGAGVSLHGAPAVAAVRPATYTVTTAAPAVTRLGYGAGLGSGSRPRLRRQSEGRQRRSRHRHCAACPTRPPLVSTAPAAVSYSAPASVTTIHSAAPAVAVRPAVSYATAPAVTAYRTAAVAAPVATFGAGLGFGHTVTAAPAGYSTLGRYSYAAPAVAAVRPTVSFATGPALTATRPASVSYAAPVVTAVRPAVSYATAPAVAAVKTRRELFLRACSELHHGSCCQLLHRACRYHIVPLHRDPSARHHSRCRPGAWHYIRSVVVVSRLHWREVSALLPPLLSPPSDQRSVTPPRKPSGLPSPSATPQPRPSRQLGRPSAIPPHQPSPLSGQPTLSYATAPAYTTSYRTATLQAPLTTYGAGLGSTVSAPAVSYTTGTPGIAYRTAAYAAPVSMYGAGLGIGHTIASPALSQQFRTVSYSAPVVGGIHNYGGSSCIRHWFLEVASEGGLGYGTYSVYGAGAPHLKVISPAKKK
ncbi:hypothetical protein MRX96_026514 [Rhipicephalus microplus]